ncbi:MAG: zf-HC2 domain-containing protein [Candidatus Jettenia sp.]|nr:MAG: zf-HC2 domain-containing protein [Candidatus Jettenia sp.]
MSCIDTMKYLHEFMDRELHEPHYVMIQKHLGHCDECRQRYEFEKGIRSLVKAYCTNITAPVYLQNRILSQLNSLDAEDTKHAVKEIIYQRNPQRTFLSSRLYAAAASILLFLAGGIFYYSNYYDNDPASIVDNAVKNHVVAVNNNLVFNEKTSVVGEVNKYLGNTINTNLDNSSPVLDAKQIRTGGIPVRSYGANSPCVIFDKGGNKLSLQTIHKNTLSTRNLERVRLGSKEFYIGNCRGFNAVLWQEDGITYCLTSDINISEMLRFAKGLTSY